MGVLWLGADWPIHDLAERYLYSVHMTQHMLFTLVAAPILIAGMPVWMYRDAAPGPGRCGTVFRFFTRPLVALIFFNGVLLFTHWPAVVEASVRSEPLHFVLHVLLVLSALAMWWPVMSPLPEMPPLSAPGQMLYLFLQSLAPTIPASFLTFGQSPLYPIYATFPRIWGVSVMTDQLMAGLIMKLVGSAILWVVIAAIFFRWFARRAPDGPRRHALRRRRARDPGGAAPMSRLAERKNRQGLLLPILLPVGALAVIGLGAVRVLADPAAPLAARRHRGRARAPRPRSSRRGLRGEPQARDGRRPLPDGRGVLGIALMIGGVALVVGPEGTGRRRRRRRDRDLDGPGQRGDGGLPARRAQLQDRRAHEPGRSTTRTPACSTTS